MTDEEKARLLLYEAIMRLDQLKEYRGLAPRQLLSLIYARTILQNDVLSAPMRQQESPGPSKP